jgi:hypothetical protein
LVSPSVLGTAKPSAWVRQQLYGSGRGSEPLPHSNRACRGVTLASADPKWQGRAFASRDHPFEVGASAQLRVRIVPTPRRRKRWPHR